MITMFSNQEKTPTKKTFQKPNILRRKPKVSLLRPNIAEANESLTEKSLVSVACLKKELNQGEHANITNVECNKIFQTIRKPPKRMSVANVYDENDTDKVGINVNSNITLYVGDNAQINYNDKYLDQNSLNIESFLNDSAAKQITYFNKEESLPEKEMDLQTKQKWCLDYINDSKEIVINNYDGSQSNNLKVEQNLTSVAPLALTLLPGQRPNSSQVGLTTVINNKNIMIDCISNKAIKFKCDEPYCTKGFWSEEKLRKHKNAHSKQNSNKPHSIIECPVKKVNADGTEQRCKMTFMKRQDLLTHLNEDHTPDDALYQCGQCGRRFFWALGLRAHSAARARCARGAAGAVGAGGAGGAGGEGGTLVCAWPGCGRTFRQPCRLREHARAHTGDRPYPCRFPNCNWSFRSASKLVRHARRHTGERRHPCGACGRAFLRREHLRDHAARHHAAPPPRASPSTAPTPAPSPAPSPTPSHHHHCTIAGCEQTFTSMSSLHTHMRRVHRKAENNTMVASLALPSAEITDSENMFVVNLVPETPLLESLLVTGPSGDTIELETEEIVNESEIGVDAETEICVDTDTEVCVDSEAQWHAARTHCTWPLLPRSEPVYEDCTDNNYVLGEDVQVEQSEASDNNIYTIRSDLFLHGNVLINEDSEFIISRDYVPRHAGAATSEHGEGEGQRAGVRSASETEQPVLDLDLIDSHPTIDLMQEELMYADAEVDETSFRVFLMNGEELT